MPASRNRFIYAVAALSSTVASMPRSVSRAAYTWLSASRVRFAVWKPLNRVCVTVAPTPCGMLTPRCENNVAPPGGVVEPISRIVVDSVCTPMLAVATARGR